MKSHDAGSLAWTVTPDGRGRSSARYVGGAPRATTRVFGLIPSFWDKLRGEYPAFIRDSCGVAGEQRLPSPRSDKPFCLHDVLANSVNRLVQVNRDADVIGHDTYPVTDPRPPAGGAQIQDPVLLGEL